MASETLLRIEAMQVLNQHFGPVETERFIASINRESIDYTESRKELFKDMSVRDLSSAAMDYYKSEL